jgi:DNA-3-methyladenine glycosylase I
VDYHDDEWGVPLKDDQKLFEFLNLEGAQAGLSWITVLRKRSRYVEVFDEFNPQKIIKYDQKKVDSLLQDQGIIRNKLKVNSVITNARIYLDLLESGTTFSDYIWSFSDGKVIQNNFKEIKDIPANTPLSDQMSKSMKKAGFKFVGSTICYAFMQAIGMVNDHMTDCFRWKELN